jgi:hypothetical protein
MLNRLKVALHVLQGKPAVYGVNFKQINLVNTKNVLIADCHAQE